MPHDTPETDGEGPGVSPQFRSMRLGEERRGGRGGDFNKVISPRLYSTGGGTVDDNISSVIK